MKVNRKYRMVTFEPQGDMKLVGRFINQWAAVVALGRGFNWVDFTFIHFSVEWKRYAGRYYEMLFIVFGLGFGVDYYEDVDRSMDWEMTDDR